MALIKNTALTYKLLIGLFLGFCVSKAIPAIAQIDIIKPANPQREVCPQPVLSRLQRHRIIPGETVASIASQYNLIPETILGLNPELKGGTLSVGQEILIPPFNGIVITAPNGATWKDLQDAYGVQADVLFEINGCQSTPKVVFIPGVDWTRSGQNNRNYTGLASYPLPFIAEIGLSYGWQKNPTNQQRLFHSGIDLLAPVGTPVLAADTGNVVYVGQEGAYGYLIVINHAGNRQTRYGHLSQITVKIGQNVAAGTTIGAVGTSGQPDLSTPHLHFEVRYKLPVGWIAQDPGIHLKVEKPLP
jgi:murein DD-endopeptidase MepM/ murein hydrolase activator NlpD